LEDVDAGLLEEAEVLDVVDVAVGVHVGPPHRDRDEGGDLGHVGEEDTAGAHGPMVAAGSRTPSIRSEAVRMCTSISSSARAASPVTMARRICSCSRLRSAASAVKS